MKSGVVILAPTIRTFTIILDFSQHYNRVGIGRCLLNLLLHYSKKLPFFEQVSGISLRKWKFKQQNVPEFFYPLATSLQGPPQILFSIKKFMRPSSTENYLTN